MFRAKFVEKIKTHFVDSNSPPLPRESYCLWGNVEKYGTAGQDTDDDVIQRMRFAFWIIKTADPNLECVILIAFPWQQCYVVLFMLVSLIHMRD